MSLTAGPAPQRGAHAALAHQCRKAEAYGLQPEQVDFLGIEPARVIFAKSGRLDEGQALEFGGVGSKVLAGFWEHAPPCIGDFRQRTNSNWRGRVPPVS